MWRRALGKKNVKKSKTGKGGGGECWSHGRGYSISLGLPEKVAFTILVFKTDRLDSRKGIKFSMLVNCAFF